MPLLSVALTVSFTSDEPVYAAPPFTVILPLGGVWSGAMAVIVVLRVALPPGPRTDSVNEKLPPVE